MSQGDTICSMAWFEKSAKLCRVLLGVLCALPGVIERGNG
jgi:hypothetical protein